MKLAARFATLALLATPLLALAACEQRTTPEAGTAPDSSPAQAPIREEPPADPEMAHMLQTAHAIELRRASLAREKAASPQVRALADSIIKDHTAMNGRAMGWLHALNLVPVDNEHSRLMNAGADDAYAALQGMSGATFDRAYVDHVVTFHQQVLDLLDEVMLPNAGGERFRNELLAQTRPLISAHLQQARDLQQSLIQ
jgi:putative membrane protein